MSRSYKLVVCFCDCVFCSGGLEVKDLLGMNAAAGTAASFSSVFGPFSVYRPAGS